MHPMPPLRTSVAMVAAHGTPLGLPDEASTILCEGWVLKKRRKKMQGFARRYFTLTQGGLLSYSFEPQQPPRDQLLIPRAAISTSPGRKDIHIDSDTATFHIKCLSTEDFNKWMAALRKFVALGNEVRRSASLRLTQSPRTAVGPSVNRTSPIVEDIGQTIQQLESALQALRQESEPKPQRLHVKDKVKEASKEGSSSMFGMFRRSSHQNLAAPELADHDRTSKRHSSAETTTTTSPAVDRIENVLRSLQSQHAALVKALPSTPQQDSTNISSPLAATAEEPDSYERDYPSRAASRTRMRPMSTATASTDTEWYDAPDAMEDGPHEFVVASGDSPDDQPSEIRTNDSQSTLESDSESDDTDFEDNDSPETDPKQQQPLASVQRRTSLPAPQPADEGSLFSVLKKNVGKDLSTISFPVTFNEPITLLQRAAEEIEYYDLLSQAAATTDPLDRLCLVTAFAVSSYAHTRHRSGRKGFNPMLAETFEDSRMNLIMEKVSHQPLIMMSHAQGEGWELTATNNGKTKFWGKSLEIIPIGGTRVQIGDDVYSWVKPSSFVRNLMVGNKYLEHVGKLIITSSSSHSKAVLEFKQSSYWGPSNLVSGHVLNAAGKPITELEGKWDEYFAQKLDSSTLRVLWRAAAYPKRTEEFYGFTSFSMSLNEMTPDLEGKLPPTDSRLRPDVRALEEGRLDEAEEDKNVIEEKQRDRKSVV